MELDQVFSEARERAARLERPRPPLSDAVEQLRSDCLAFFRRLPEPPVYRRPEDPAVRQAEALLLEARDLLARVWVLLSEPEPMRDVQALAETLMAHIECLWFVARGDMIRAELGWEKAASLEQRALRARRLWFRTDEAAISVYDKQTGSSRFDPRPEPVLRVKLSCPQPTCRRVNDYSVSPTQAKQAIGCVQCGAPFTAYFCEVRSVELERRGRYARHYVFRLEELGGRATRLEFEDVSGVELSACPRDFLVFLYRRPSELSGVLNLSTSRLLWVHPKGGCFVATVAFGGADAPELRAFRAFRDRTLEATRFGRAFIWGYYRVGPRLARAVERAPLLRRVANAGLRCVHGMLVRSGFDE